jgi:hypothetical protein
MSSGRTERQAPSPNLGASRRFPKNGASQPVDFRGSSSKIMEPTKAPNCVQVDTPSSYTSQFPEIGLCEVKQSSRQIRLQPPNKSGFEQVHLARRFGASNLVKTPFSGNDTEGAPAANSRTRSKTSMNRLVDAAQRPATQWTGVLNASAPEESFHELTPPATRGA